MKQKTNLTEQLKDRVYTEIDLILSINDDNEYLVYATPEDAKIGKDEYLKPLKKEFKNILLELEEDQIPLIGFYDDDDEDPDPYTNIMQYIRQIHNIASEDFNMIMESYESSYPLNYDAQTVIEIASIEEFNLLTTLDDKNNEIELTAHETIFNKTIYTLRIHDYKYLDQVYELTENQMIRTIADYNRDKIIYIDLLADKIGLETF